MRSSAGRFDRAGWLTGWVALVQAMRLVRLARLPEPNLVDNLPDDAYYYLQLARNFARLGRWTFDGVAPASGFHVLWGYLLAGLFRVAPNASLHQVFAAAASVELVCMVAATWLLTRTAQRLFGPAAVWGVAVVLLSAVSLSIGLALMESSLVLLFSAALLHLLCRLGSPASPRALVGAFLLGLGGMAARSDFGLLPAMFCFAFLLARLVPAWAARSPRGALRTACAALGGSMLGGLLLALHTHWISGNWVQSSVRQKLWWSQLQGYSLAPVLRIVGMFYSLATNTWYLAHRPELAALALVRGLEGLVLVGALWTLFKMRRRAEAVLILGLLLTVAAYIAFYRQNSADIMFWYIAPFEGPVALLTGAAFAACASRVRWVMPALACCLCTAGIGLSFKPMFAYQRMFYQAGLSLRDHPELAPAGGWNSGMVGYFSGGRMTNLDGLVNDQILPFEKSGTLARYVGERHLRTIIDIDGMFDADIAVRVGIADGKLAGCLVADKTWHDTAQYYAGDERMKIYHVKPDCPGLR